MIPSIDVAETKTNIRIMCKSEGLTRRQVADYCNVSMKAVGRWYAPSGGMPSIDNLISLSHLLNCSINDLIILH